MEYRDISKLVRSLRYDTFGMNRRDRRAAISGALQAASGIPGARASRDVARIRSDADIATTRMTGATQRDVAGIGAEAHRDVAKTGAEAHRYSADAAAGASRYSADVGERGKRYWADKYTDALGSQISAPDMGAILDDISGIGARQEIPGQVDAIRQSLLGEEAAEARRKQQKKSMARPSIGEDVFGLDLEEEPVQGNFLRDFLNYYRR